jgi:protein gp37
MADTKIEWCNKTWNPITGCTPASEGCRNCYAKRIAETRLAGRFGYPAHDPFKPGIVHEDKWGEPEMWKKPSRIFVCSMGDLFHKDIPVLTYNLIEDKESLNPIYDSILGNIAVWQKHTFFMLTKRPQQMKKVLENYLNRKHYYIGFSEKQSLEMQQLQNLWLGVSVENQKTANERIPILLQTQAVKRFVSIEPMLDYVFLNDIHYSKYVRVNALEGCGVDVQSPYQANQEFICEKLDWVILGGETGSNARPIPDQKFVKDVLLDCQQSNVPFFFKQWGSNKCNTIDGEIYQQFPDFT